MIRSMMSPTDLPFTFWGYALEIAAFTLNRVPSKAVEKTPYEMWIGKRPSLYFLKIWGCEASVCKSTCWFCVFSGIDPNVSFSYPHMGLSQALISRRPFE